MPERARAQQADGPDHLVITAAPVRVPPMPVVSGPVTIYGDADLDVMLSEELAVLLAEQDAVGVDPQVQVAQAIQCFTEFGHDPAQPGRASEQRFSAVQYDLHGGQCMRGHMIRDAPRRVRDHLIGDDRRPPAPALVSRLVDIAMITGQITAAVDLQDDLAQRNRQPAHATLYLDGRTEGRAERTGRRGTAQNTPH